MNPTAIRLLSQQLAAPQFDSPAEVVSHMGAMQAQEYRQMRWAVAMRTKKPSYEAFRKDFDEGRIIRLHLLRGTWQIVSGDDYWWMLDLCREKAEKVIRGWMSANRISLSDRELAEMHDLICATTERIGSATKEDYAETLRQKGIAMDDHRLSYHIRFNELNGTLCSGNLEPMKATYSLSGSKVPHSQDIDRDEALMLLARKYFQSHSPATLEDYVWWSGLNIGDCRRGIELLGGELHGEKWKGYNFFVHESCRMKEIRKGDTLLLPAYDEYLIGYKSRELALAPDQAHHAHSKNGIFYPVIAVDGKICGNWSAFKKNPEAVFFEEGASPNNIEKLWEQYQRAKKKDGL